MKVHVTASGGEDGYPDIDREFDEYPRELLTHYRYVNACGLEVIALSKLKTGNIYGQKRGG